MLTQVLGQCEVFEEKQVGNERFNIFNGCPSGETATIVLRGGADQVRLPEKCRWNAMGCCLHFRILMVELMLSSLLKKQSGVFMMPS
jgi:hypothetical protein